MCSQLRERKAHNHDAREHSAETYVFVVNPINQ
jgi:hypothetical protein